MPGRALLCMPVLGQSCYHSWVLTMSMLGKPLLGSGMCPALFPSLSSQLMGILGGTATAASFGGFPH